jgi:hypothetical protein
MFLDAAMSRVWKHHYAERSFVGELKKGACGEWVASHIRVRRLLLSANADCVMIGEEKAKVKAGQNKQKWDRLTRPSDSGGSQWK